MMLVTRVVQQDPASRHVFQRKLAHPMGSIQNVMISGGGMEDTSTALPRD